MDPIEDLLEALADAARNDRKREFDRLERELLTRFEGSFDAMPPDVYARYLEIDRLWPVVPPSGDARDPHRNTVRVSLTARDEAWLRQIGADVDRSLSAVLTACLDLVREDAALADAVARKLRRPGRSD